MSVPVGFTFTHLTTFLKSLSISPTNPFFTICTEKWHKYKKMKTDIAPTQCLDCNMLKVSPFSNTDSGKVSETTDRILMDNRLHTTGNHDLNKQRNPFAFFNCRKFDSIEEDMTSY